MCCFYINSRGTKLNLGHSSTGNLVLNDKLIYLSLNFNASICPSNIPLALLSRWAFYPWHSHTYGDKTGHVYHVPYTKWWWVWRNEGDDILFWLIITLSTGHESQDPSMATIVPTNVIAIIAANSSAGIMLTIKWDIHFRKFLYISMILNTFLLIREHNSKWWWDLNIMALWVLHKQIHSM